MREMRRRVCGVSGHQLLLRVEHHGGGEAAEHEEPPGHHEGQAEAPALVQNSAWERFQGSL